MTPGPTSGKMDTPTVLDVPLEEEGEAAEPTSSDGAADEDDAASAGAADDDAASTTGDEKRARKPLGGTNCSVGEATGVNNSTVHRR